MYSGLLVAGIVLLANSAFAAFQPVPDGGSSALLLVLSVSGLALGRKMLRSKDRSSK